MWPDMYNQNSFVQLRTSTKLARKSVQFAESVIVTTGTSGHAQNEGTFCPGELMTTTSSHILAAIESSTYFENSTGSTTFLQNECAATFERRLRLRQALARNVEYRVKYSKVPCFC